ncbi:MAG: outer membrane beta-barrel family protein [Paramuribaculum sp.]|nr:outer membrane beta-barrel family protein [Paramuribaculum sp.]
MKKTLLPLIIMAAVATASAQEIVVNPDSIDAGALDEVTVEAKMQRTSAKSSIYIPDGKQKNAANNATSLLNIMAIPQLSVDPISEAVKTIAGQPVAVFIDGIEASPEDLSGLMPRDVKRVEYYDNPADPKFSGKKHVVNFIMQQYEWGGYTKIDAQQSIGVRKTDASVYSKMKYKAMTFDIYGSEKYSAIRNAGSETVEEMHFTDLNDTGPATIERATAGTTENTHNNTNDVSLRAIYDTDKVQLNNRVGINYSNSPNSITSNDVTYSGDMSGYSRTLSGSSNKNITARYAGQYLLTFPHNFTLNIGTRGEYGNNRTASSYYDSGNLAINNNAREKSFSGIINPNLYWQINECNTLRGYIVGLWRHSTIDYSGNTSSCQTYGIEGYQGGASYDFETDKWSTYINAAWSCQTNTISSYKIRTTYPKINADVSYSPTGNSQLYASYSYYETFPFASTTSPVMLRQDELMWYAGNPKLKNSPTHEIGVQGMWLPSNKWQIALSCFSYNMSDRRVAEYVPDGPDGTMLRRYTNNGTYQSTMIGLNATAKFLNGKLAARLNPQVWLRKTTGVFSMRRNELTCTAQLSYYFGNFYVNGWYSTPSHYPDENSGIEKKTTSQYQLQCGWGNSSWNVRIAASNFFRSAWNSNKETLHSKYYNMSTRVYSPENHLKFSLSATYTIGYGKKVERNNELNKESSGASAILK